MSKVTFLILLFLILLFFQPQGASQTAQDPEKQVQQLLTNCVRADKNLREVHARLLAKLDSLRNLQFEGKINDARTERDKFAQTAIQFEGTRRELDQQSKQLLTEAVKFASGTPQNRTLSKEVARFRNTLQLFVVPEDADEVFLQVNRRIVEAEKQAEKKK